ncbi:isochorismate synthase [Synechocystis sp. LEGE 06083]|uniref:isochorismate synthase n=1 Tax=Synechocystis sp. LEGE 06083 TaxID=915336 RepID=UPI0018801F5C|nr:isochorismate synthase [Synechocystis sp. LEGE 06083]MBE9197346.1 isochorismate synthase [Synechocystis sp. LEGE 06083]
MSVATPLLDRHPCSLDNSSVLHGYLLGQQRGLAPGQRCLWSFTENLGKVDPLAVFGALNVQDQVHFYGENPQRGETILAFGICQSLRISGKYRFRLAQQFAEECFQRLVPIGNAQGRSQRPYIFCGFSFFDRSSNRNPFANSFLFLPQIQVVKTSQHCLLSWQVSLDSNTDIIDLVDFIGAMLSAIRRVQPARDNHTAPMLARAPRLTAIEVAKLSTAIASSLEEIAQQRLSKVVLATALDLDYGCRFNTAHCLQRLRQQYGDCHLFSWGNGQGDCFVGASPERLLSLHNQQLVTDALAGSAPRAADVQGDRQLGQQLLHNPKELREHQAVLDYLLQRLRALGLSPQASSLKLLKLANIQHLWTQIQAPLPPHIHPLALVEQLHPTPAVAGVPVAIAEDLIRRHETFDRNLYAAPLGWLDSEGNSEFIVGIRSALLSRNRARLYAGAGIVAGSDPLKEVAEIELKLQTLWRSLI